MAPKWRMRGLKRGVGLSTLLLGLLIATAPGSPASACPPESAGFYNAAQAKSGKMVFDTHCAACHNAALTGGAGPPLTGAPFEDSLAFSKITGAQLFEFISTQMPYDAPGSLSKTDYEDAFAYILSIDHYPQGSTMLDQNSVSCIRMLPYPKQN